MQNNLIIRLSFGDQENSRAAAFQRVNHGILLSSSLFNLIHISNDSPQGDAVEVEYICELGKAILSAVLDETNKLQSEVKNDESGN